MGKVLAGGGRESEFWQEKLPGSVQQMLLTADALQIQAAHSVCQKEKSKNGKKKRRRG